jgi:hypothetical protein
VDDTLKADVDSEAKDAQELTAKKPSGELAQEPNTFRVELPSNQVAAFKAALTTQVAQLEPSNQPMAPSVAKAGANRESYEDAKSSPVILGGRAGSAAISGIVSNTMAPAPETPVLTEPPAAKPSAKSGKELEIAQDQTRTEEDLNKLRVDNATACPILDKAQPATPTEMPSYIAEPGRILLIIKVVPPAE